MTSRPVRITTANPRFAWLLWFALLIPLAQFAANWHAQSHWDTERTSTPIGKHALAGDRCDLCLTAAALASGAAAVEPSAVAHPSISQPAPRVHPGRAPWAPLSLAYESRAPPLVLR